MTDTDLDALVAEMRGCQNHAVFGPWFKASADHIERLVREKQALIDAGIKDGRLILDLVVERDAARAECESWKKQAEIQAGSLQEARAECERLRAENEAMRYDLNILRQYHHEGCMAEIEALRKDAERYRWLRVRINESLDEYIDASLGSKP